MDGKEKDGYISRFIFLFLYIIMILQRIVKYLLFAFIVYLTITFIPPTTYETTIINMSILTCSFALIDMYSPIVIERVR